MTWGFTITIADADGAPLERVFVRETYGPTALAESIGKHALRYRQEIWGDRKTLITIVRENRPEFGEPEVA